MATKNATAKKIIKEIAEGRFENLYVDAEQVWKDVYEEDDISIKLLVNCLKIAKKKTVMVTHWH